MPAGVRVLDELGTSRLLSGTDCATLVGIRYVQEDGSFAEGRLPAPGLGIRRTALTRSLARCAEGFGAELRWSTSVAGFRTTSRYVSADTSRGEVRARLLVAADGVHSRLRRLAGLELAPLGPPRLGLRQHFRVEPWSAFVEIHLSDGVEAFVTPAGSGTGSSSWATPPAPWTPSRERGSLSPSATRSPSAPSFPGSSPSAPVARISSPWSGRPTAGAGGRASSPGFSSAPRVVPGSAEGSSAPSGRDRASSKR